MRIGSRIKHCVHWERTDNWDYWSLFGSIYISNTMSLIPVMAIERVVLTFHYVKPKSGIHQHTTKRVVPKLNYKTNTFNITEIVSTLNLNEFWQMGLSIPWDNFKYTRHGSTFTLNKTIWCFNTIRRSSDKREIGPGLSDPQLSYHHHDNFQFHVHYIYMYIFFHWSYPTSFYHWSYLTFPRTFCFKVVLSTASITQFSKGRALTFVVESITTFTVWVKLRILAFLTASTLTRLLGLTIPNIFLWANLDSILWASYNALTELPVSEISPKRWSPYSHLQIWTYPSTVHPHHFYTYIQAMQVSVLTYMSHKFVSFSVSNFKLKLS